MTADANAESLTQHIELLQSRYDVVIRHKRKDRLSWMGFSEPDEDSIDEPIQVHSYENEVLIRTMILTEAELRMLARWSQYR